MSGEPEGRPLRTIKQASRSRNLSWYGRMKAALMEVGRPDLADRVGFRGNDGIYNAAGERVAYLGGGCCPTFAFDATEDEWRLIERAAHLTQSERPSWDPTTDMVEWARSLGRVKEPTDG